MGSMGPLLDNSKVVILGGGPSGAACAMALKRKATMQGKRIEIILIEGKQFAGELHHNQCVGVLSPPLPRLLSDELGIPFPDHLSRSNITGYVLHTKTERIALDGGEEVSIALRRVQFDEFMLEEVRKQGITVVRARAVDLEIHEDKVVIYTENKPVEGDVVVGAFGLDEGSAAMFGRVSVYQPPNELSSVVTKYHPRPEVMSLFGERIHAFLPTHPRIEFGGITPKGNHLTINIAGKTVDSPLMRSFLSLPEVENLLDHMKDMGKFDPNDAQLFKGRFPCTLAKGYYGDRYVMVGDAAGLVRSFKGKGVTSGIQTGIRAANTMLFTGISKEAFQNDYYRANDDIISDLPYGRVMRFVTITLARYGLLDAVVRAAESDAGLRGALFGAVSAQFAYKPVLRKAFNPARLLGVVRSLPNRRYQTGIQEEEIDRHVP
jgi:flavin-dependent dehydrogenase